jgi:hypothetical protein
LNRLRKTQFMDVSLAREGEYWVVRGRTGEVRVRDSKGVRYLERLLAQPGIEMHALDLVGGQEVGPARTGEAELSVRADLGDAGEMLDSRAKAAYASRVEYLREEIAEAESFNDPERAAHARAELDFVARELAGAVGLRGRDRKA